MYKTIPGTCRSGVVTLAEPPPDLSESPVLVIFLKTEGRQMNATALEPAQLAELRGKLAAWEEDWNVQGMEAYDKP